MKSLLGIAVAVLIVLKIIGYIAWPWIWILAPLWVPIVLRVIMWIVIGIGFFIGYIGRSINK